MGFNDLFHQLHIFFFKSHKSNLSHTGACINQAFNDDRRQMFCDLRLIEIHCDDGRRGWSFDCFHVFQKFMLNNIFKIVKGI